MMNMKKLLSLLLALVMCLSLAACGGDDAPSDNGDDAPPAVSDTGDADGTEDPGEEAGGDYCSNYEVMSDFELYVVLPVDLLTAAPWKFTGGYNISGTELTQEEVEGMNAEYGGAMQIEFVDEEAANLILGEGKAAGTYRVLDDGASINFTFGQDTVIEYVGAFTAMGEDEIPVLLLTSAGTPSTVLYMT